MKVRVKFKLIWEERHQGECVSAKIKIYTPGKRFAKIIDSILVRSWGVYKTRESYESECLEMFSNKKNIIFEIKECVFKHFKKEENKYEEDYRIKQFETQMSQLLKNYSKYQEFEMEV